MLTERDIDIHVGQQVRKRRKALGLSQTALAKHLGLTFQQVQKMEKGVNRIGAGRLKQLTIVLDVPIETFYDGIMSPQDQQTGVATREGDNKYPGLPQPLQKQINALIAEIEKTLG
ncbi:MAG: helix-turn-helix transcriptional regulator [Pseudomonadota bacterium]